MARVSDGPLAGLRAVEISDGTAAAFCGKLLSDLGVDVVRVEPRGGHQSRNDAPLRSDGLSARFTYLNTGKASVELNVDGSEPDLAELVRGAQLVITDAAADRVAALVPGDGGTVVVTVRPFGATGPYADRQAHHLTVFHAGGEGALLPSGLGFKQFPERAPIQLGSEIGWFDAGWNATVAAVAACYELLRSGTSQRVDVSAQESQLTLNRTRLSRFNNDGIVLGREESRYGSTGMMRCRDGWVQLVGLRPEQWEALGELPDAEEVARALAKAGDDPAERDAMLGAALAAWCSARPKNDVAASLSSLGAAVGVHRTPADLLASDQLAHREFFRDVADGRGGSLTLPGPPYRFSRTPATVDAAPELGQATPWDELESRAVAAPHGDAGRLLEGVRVLDFTWAAAGPYATLLLSFLGADVVKVESSRRPDPARRGFLADYGGINRSPNFNELNLGKRSVQLDLTQPESRAVVDALVAEVDVVIDNFRPGVMGRFGLGPDELLARHPHLVVASSSANGATGPEAMGAGFASVFAASGGLSEQTGYLDGPPTEVGESVDYRSGNALAVGVLAALVHRLRTGEGQHVDVASCEVVIASAPDALLAHLVDAPWTPRLGNRHHEMVPHDVYRCGDGGWLAIAVGDEAQWAALCEVLGRPDWVQRYPSPASRRDAEAEIEPALSEWIAARDAGEASSTLAGAGVPAGAVMTNAEVARDPHLAERGVLVEVEHPEIGRQTVMRPPWLFSESSCAIGRPGPLLGADTDAVVHALNVPIDLDEATREKLFR